VKISTALKELFATESIKTKAHLDAWCGKASRARLYAYVQEQAPENWARVADPKAVTRGTYQSLLTGYGSDAASGSDEEEPALGSRITNLAEAEARIGRVCTYVTTEGREYGRILRATASEIVLERLSTAGGGIFVLHPVPVCPRSRNHVTYSRDIRLVAERPKSCACSPPATPPASPAVSAAPSPEALALKLAEELAEVHKREIARLTAVEAEFLSLKSKMEAARLKRNEAVRAYKARAKKSSGVPKAVEDTKKDLMDVFDFFPELVEELASGDPVHLG